MKKKLNQSLKFKKTTISTLSEKSIKGGFTTSDIYTSRFADFCYGAQTSYILVCAIQCAPTTTEP